MREHTELVTSEARQHVARAKLRVEPSRDRFQEAVAGDVTVRVVDRLEAIEVDEEHAIASRWITARLRNRALYELAEERAVREIRQRVVLCRLCKRVADAALLRDVGLRTGKSNCASILALGDAPAVHPPEASVHVTDPVLDLEVRPFARQVCLDRLLQRGTVFLV